MGARTTMVGMRWVGGRGGLVWGGEGPRVLGTGEVMSRGESGGAMRVSRRFGRRGSAGGGWGERLIADSGGDGDADSAVGTGEGEDAAGGDGIRVMTASSGSWFGGVSGGVCGRFSFAGGVCVWGTSSAIFGGSGGGGGGGGGGGNA